jgi:hypothetical protein
MSGAFARDAPRYYAAGVNVLPIAWGTKQPPAGVSWRPWQRRRQTEAELGQLIEAYPTADVALVCGCSGGLVDIETDGPSGEDALRALRVPLPVTARWTAPRGLHRIYRATRWLPSRIRLRDGLDVLASGRYVVAPRSAGREWLTPGGLADVAPLPEAWADLLAPAATRGLPDSLHVAELAGVEHGHRNMMLAGLVGRWMSQRLPKAEVLHRAHDFARQCRPPLDRREAERAVASVFDTRARARLRGRRSSSAASCA